MCLIPYRFACWPDSGLLVATQLLLQEYKWLDRGHGKATLQQTIASIDERCRSPQITMWDLYRFNIHPWKIGVSASAAFRPMFNLIADLLELSVYFACSRYSSRSVAQARKMAAMLRA